MSDPVTPARPRLTWEVSNDECVRLRLGSMEVGRAHPYEIHDYVGPDPWIPKASGPMQDGTARLRSIFLARGFDVDDAPDTTLNLKEP